LAREVVLKRQKRFAYAIKCRNPRSRLAHTPLAQAGIVQPIKAQGARRSHRGGLVIERKPMIEHVACNRAVEQAGVQIGQPEMSGEPARYASFA